MVAPLLVPALMDADESAAAALVAVAEEERLTSAERPATVGQRVDDLAKRLARINESRMQIEEGWAVFQASVNNGSPSEDIDEVIDAMLGLEETIKPALEQAGWSGGLFSMPDATARERARSIVVVERLEEAFRDAYADIQDKRLWAMAKRAELEDPGDSPVFDDFDELLKYLNR